MGLRALTHFQLDLANIPKVIEGKRLSILERNVLARAIEADRKRIEGQEQSTGYKGLWK